MTAVLPFPPKTKLSPLKEAILDYGIEATLSELIAVIESECLDHLDCAIILSYLIQSNRYISVINNREKFRFERKFPEFIDFEVSNEQFLLR